MNEIIGNLGYLEFFRVLDFGFISDFARPNVPVRNGRVLRISDFSS